MEKSKDRKIEVVGAGARKRERKGKGKGKRKKQRRKGNGNEKNERGKKHKVYQLFVSNVLYKLSGSNYLFSLYFYVMH